MTMRIVHAMFARHMGGIEFSFLRWTEALRSLGHEVVCVVDSQADVSSHLPSDTQQISVRQAFDWDPLAIWQLRRELRCLAPDMMITHGNRAGRLLHRANKNQTPHLSVLHRPR
ncbi:MAG: glycosyltransferase, partial [Rickettsiales bacterium]|nr:glycosyltransferase [Rickettsiales bacterium]